jgi:hypothetical protein
MSETSRGRVGNRGLCLTVAAAHCVDRVTGPRLGASLERIHVRPEAQ